MIARGSIDATTAGRERAMKTGGGQEQGLSKPLVACVTAQLRPPGHPGRGRYNAPLPVLSGPTAALVHGN
jgi:hypothetical protein